jgi:hypothetical protein
MHDDRHHLPVPHHPERSPHRPDLRPRSQTAVDVAVLVHILGSTIDVFAAAEPGTTANRYALVV